MVARIERLHGCQCHINDTLVRAVRVWFVADALAKGGQHVLRGDWYFQGAAPGGEFVVDVVIAANHAGDGES